MPEGYFNRKAARDNAAVYESIAARTVAKLAPPPDPMTDDYPSLARDAEQLVYNYLTTTAGGTLTAASLSGEGSFTAAGLESVKGLIRDSMGSYYQGGTVRSVPII